LLVMRLRRSHIFGVLVWVSALGLAIVVGLWIRSYVEPNVAEGPQVVWRQPDDVRPYLGHAIQVLSHAGGIRIHGNRLVLTQERDIAPYLRQPQRRVTYARIASWGPPAKWWHTLLFEWEPPRVQPWSRPPQKVVTMWDARVPYWFACLALALLPTYWIKRRIRQHRRRAAGLCPKCGYDRRATPECCPECGTTEAAAAELTDPQTLHM
jgi:hypothetical protein